MRFFRSVTPFALLASFAACTHINPAIRSTPENAALARTVRKSVEKTGAHFGIAARHVESGRTFTWNAGESFEAASVVKIALLAQALGLWREGALDLSERWTLTPPAVAAGSGILDEFEPGLNPTLKDLLRIMCALSDNTAANSFIDRFGAPAVNARMESLGLPGIRLLGRIPDRDPEESEASRWKGLRLGSMTPGDTAAFYEKIVLGSLIDGEASRLAARLLRNPRTSDRIPRHLRSTPDATWAGKTGTMNGVRNDSGILTTRKGNFVFAVFADRMPETEAWKAGPAMGEVARAIVNEWSRDLPDLPPVPAARTGDGQH